MGSEIYVFQRHNNDNNNNNNNNNNNINNNNNKNNNNRMITGNILLTKLSIPLALVAILY